MTHESNGIDIITALILNDISPLCKYRMDLVLQLKVTPSRPVGVHVACAMLLLSIWWYTQDMCVCMRCAHKGV